MTISVIIPVYNAEQTIKRCIESVVYQTRKADEIIIVNDGSTDNTQNIIEHYSFIEEKIQIINKKNGGLSSARNTGIKHANCEYILFLDSDDELVENTIEKSLSYFTDDVDSVWYKTIIECDYDESLKNRVNKYMNYGPCGNIFIDDDLLMNLNVAAWSKIVKRKNLLDSNIFFPEGMYNEDEVFHCNYFSIYRKSYMLKDELYIYHLSKDSIMGKIRNKTENMRIHMIWNIELVYNFWIKNNLYNGREDIFEKIIIKFFNAAFCGVPNFERSRCVWEITKLLRKLNLTYKSGFIQSLYEGRIFINIGSTEDEVKKLRKTINILNKKIAQQDEKIEILKNSTSYKIGRFFTYIPRKIKLIKNKNLQNNA